MIYAVFEEFYAYPVPADCKEMGLCQFFRQEHVFAVHKVDDLLLSGTAARRFCLSGRSGSLLFLSSIFACVFLSGFAVIFFRGCIFSLLRGARRGLSLSSGGTGRFLRAGFLRRQSLKSFQNIVYFFDFPDRAHLYERELKHDLRVKGTPYPLSPVDHYVEEKLHSFGGLVFHQF